MSLLAGTITVNGDGTYAGTGLAKGLMDAKVNALIDSSTAWATRSTTDKVAMYTYFADEAQRMASAIVSHLTTNGAIPINAGQLDAGVPSVNRSFPIT